LAYLGRLRQNRLSENAVNGLKSCSSVPSQHWLSQIDRAHYHRKLLKKGVWNAWKFGKPYISKAQHKNLRTSFWNCFVLTKNLQVVIQAPKLAQMLFRWWKTIFEGGPNLILACPPLLGYPNFLHPPYLGSFFQIWEICICHTSNKSSEGGE